MDYLGSGKVIIGNMTETYRDLGLIEMADNEKSFLAIFERVLSDLAAYNSDEAQSRRKNYAWENTYSHQLERVEKWLRSG
jgi:hypothetical protein